jgi:hypothetical protein
MQLNIVVDEKGDVVGTFRSEIRGTDGAVIRAGIYKRIAFVGSFPSAKWLSFLHSL